MDGGDRVGWGLALVGIGVTLYLGLLAIPNAQFPGWWAVSAAIFASGLALAVWGAIGLRSRRRERGNARDRRIGYEFDTSTGRMGLRNKMSRPITIITLERTDHAVNWDAVGANWEIPAKGFLPLNARRSSPGKSRITVVWADESGAVNRYPITVQR